jgi:hypothetical protein
MDGVSSFGFCNGLIAVNDQSELYLFDADGGCTKVVDGIRAVENGFIYDNDNTLLYLDSDGVLISTQIQAKQATRLGNEKILVLDINGCVFIYEKSAEPRKIADKARLLVEAQTILFIDDDNHLCTIIDDLKVVLDSEVLYAASSVDRVLLYIKSDMTLWKIQPIVQQSFLEVEWYKLPPNKIWPDAPNEG